jgi:succinate-semialdehyde dehydrogenase/glutarate-semialdehyde dehydrogenase
MFESINPHTLEAIANRPAWKADQLSAAICSSDRAFQHWRKRDLPARSAKVAQLAEVLEMNRARLAKMATLEMGKPIAEAEAEVEKCAWLCRHYAQHAAAYLADEHINTDASTSWIAYEPLGVILGVMPWNYPYWQVLRYAVPTLLAGNTVAVKHASNVQGCATEIESLFAEAGFPKHCYTNLPIGSALVGQVIEDPHVKCVSLTGSEGAGAAVAKIAGANLKKSLLELGGSNAFIVLADADMDAVVALALKARMQNNGQSCIAAKRFIVHASLAADFAERLSQKAMDMKTGDPMNRDVELGPLARVDLAETLDAQVQQSIEMGAKLHCGGERDGAFYAATVLSDVRPGMPAFDEETFGPVAAITTAKTDEEAIFLANTSRYGLGATICSSDTQRAKKLGNDLKDGAVFINEMVKSDPRLPFGGTGISGYGRELGAHGIREFVNVKTYYLA